MPQEPSATWFRRIGKFFIAIFSDWLARMSGPLTVPFTIAALFVSATTYKLLFAILAVLAGSITCYRVWVKEYDRAEQLNKRLEDQTPSFKGQILEAFICVAEYIAGDAFIHLNSSIVLLKVVAWNSTNIAPTSVAQCRLNFKLYGVEYHGETHWKPKQGFHQVILAGRDQNEANMMFQMGVGLGDLLYLSRRESYLLFYVDGLRPPYGQQIYVADLDLELVDLLGNVHHVSGAQISLIRGRTKCHV